jgi:hypothetical protein
MDSAAERNILIRRFILSDRSLFELGRKLRLSWFERFEPKFSRDTYAYFAPEEKIEATELICKQLEDSAFITSLNDLGPKYFTIDTFVGERYFFDGTKFSLEDRRQELKDDVKGAIKETGGRGAIFLRAIISLHRAGMWDKAYGGATWSHILANIREMGGSYPSPRDLSILKSYKIYYKTGSRRYPTHTIPEEMIPTVEEVLIELPAISAQTKTSRSCYNTWLPLSFLIHLLG